MSDPFAGPSTQRIPIITGTVPGVLDRTQPERLLRQSGSKLSFASFDPRTATSQKDVPDLRKLSLNEELYKPKRVVVETTPAGECFWRFVPSARRAEGVPDEGKWPMPVELCGKVVYLSQDQWDIYKLDPCYDCFVKPSPGLITITRIISTQRPLSASPLGKRRMASSSPERPMPPPNPRKKVNTTKILYDGFSSSEDDDNEEDKVEEMVIDDNGVPTRPRSTQGERAKKFKEEIKKNRQERREKVSRRTERLAQQDEKMFDFSGDRPQQSTTPPDPSGKRKVNSLSDSLRTCGDPDYAERPAEDDHLRKMPNYASTKNSKRTRTVSPSAAKRDLEAKRLEREKQKKDRREQELNHRREERDKRFMNEILSEIPEGIHANGNSARNGANIQKPDSSDESNSEDEDAARRQSIEESRRKLAELEADRPIRGAEAKKRGHTGWGAEVRNWAETLKAEAERGARKLQEQAAWMREEALRQQRQAREQQEQAARMHEEALRQQREEMARKEQEKQRRQQRLSHGPWTEYRAFQRYRTLSEAFDTKKFSDKEPLTCDAIPWPVLQSPATFSMEDVDWASVEQFFATIKAHMRPQDYKVLVERSHRRFHPDRWRARSLLKTVVDEAERGCMEVAANTVAQALTPIWQELTGR